MNKHMTVDETTNNKNVLDCILRCFGFHIHLENSLTAYKIKLTYGNEGIEGIIEGGVAPSLDSIITKNWFVAWCPAWSVAVHNTAVSPTLNTLPDGGVHVTVTFSSTLSVTNT